MKKLIGPLLTLFVLIACDNDRDTTILERADKLNREYNYRDAIDTLSDINISKLSKDEWVDYTYLLYDCYADQGLSSNYDSLLNPLLEYQRSIESSDTIKTQQYKIVGMLLNKDYSGALRYINQIIETLDSDGASYLFNFKGVALLNLEEYDLVDTLASEVMLLDAESRDTKLLFISNVLRGFIKVNDVERVKCYADRFILLIESEINNQDNSRFYMPGLVTEYVKWLKERGEYREAYDYVDRFYRVIYNRDNIKVANLVKAQLKLEIGDLDSAQYFARLAVESKNTYIVQIANQLLKKIAFEMGDFIAATSAAENELENFYNIGGNINSSISIETYQKLLLENENRLLKSQKQNRDLIIIIIVITVVVLALSLRVVINRRDNQLLRQSAEIAQMRENEAILREGIFRRIDLFKKIPSISNQVGKSKTKRILLSKEEWLELVASMNEVYPNFVGSLREQFPQLSDDDISFCCFLKINVNLQDLSDIYCVSKSAITKRKYRIKTEKLGILNPDISLDTFLKNR